MNSLFLSPSMRRIFLEVLILCVLSATVGLSLNFKLIFRVFSGKSVAPAVSNSAETSEGTIVAADAIDAFPIPIELVDLDELLSAGALLIDARSFHSYQQEHLAGALSLPFADFANQIEKFKQLIPVDQTLITYCSGYGCPDSFDLGVRLIQEGYLDVLVYEGGLPEWKDAGRALEGANQ
ncbi:MAG: rhodanese-like domain-containing protein [Desulfuromusa sp.]|nr:rhodanese-like domain-containing protein [Desulfuromusa sp.]